MTKGTAVFLLDREDVIKFTLGFDDRQEDLQVELMLRGQAYKEVAQELAQRVTGEGYYLIHVGSPVVVVNVSEQGIVTPYRKLTGQIAPMELPVEDTEKTGS